MSRSSIIILAGIVLVLSAFTARMFIGAHLEIKRATTAFEQNKHKIEIQHLRRAFAFYLPYNPWVKQAHARLLTIARNSEKTGNSSLALDAWRQLRCAILSLRSINSPFFNSLLEINNRIVALSTKEPSAAQKIKTSEGQKEFTLRLSKPPQTNPVWTAFGLLGFATWIAGGFALLLLGLHKDASIIPNRFWPYLGIIAIGFILFCVGMRLA